MVGLKVPPKRKRRPFRKKRPKEETQSDAYNYDEEQLPDDPFEEVESSQLDDVPSTQKRTRRPTHTPKKKRVSRKKSLKKEPNPSSPEMVKPFLSHPAYWEFGAFVISITKRNFCLYERKNDSDAWVLRGYYPSLHMLARTLPQWATRRKLSKSDAQTLKEIKTCLEEMKKELLTTLPNLFPGSVTSSLKKTSRKRKSSCPQKND